MSTGIMMTKKYPRNPVEIRRIPENTNHSHRKRNLCIILKVVVFVACLVGFGLQTTEFLENFYKYPTVINTAIEKLVEFPTPALTYCSNYQVDYGKYCRLYSEYCEGPKDVESFCKDYPLKCDGNKTDIITSINFRGFYDDNLRELAYNTSDVISFHPDFQFFEGPFIFQNLLLGDTDVCYRLGTGFTETGLHTFPMVGTRSRQWTTLVVSFNRSESIYMHVEDKPFGRLSIHSPLHTYKSSSKSVVIRAGYQYEIYVNLEAERLLPSPYETHCKDYEKLWKKNHSAPLSQDMCQHLCMTDVNYFESGFNNYEYCDGAGGEEIFDYPPCVCYQNCKDECLKLTYHFTSFESKLMVQKDSELKAMVSIFIETNAVRFTYHKAQYIEVELFGYLGGILGCWLGISIWSVSEVIWEGFDIISAKVKYHRNDIRRDTLVQNVNLARKISLNTFII